MTNDKFKDKLARNGVLLLGIYCGHDVVINKDLEFKVKVRKKPEKPNLKLGEVVVISALDLRPHVNQLIKEAIDTVLAMHDVLPTDNRDEKIKQYDAQIKHQLELVKYQIIIELINEITPIKQTQIYYKLGIKNADRLVDGTDSSPIY